MLELYQIMNPFDYWANSGPENVTYKLTKWKTYFSRKSNFQGVCNFVDPCNPLKGIFEAQTYVHNIILPYFPSFRKWISQIA